MGTRTQYTPGTFSWVDLSSPDQAGSKQFYSELFGWTYDDTPVGDGVVYSMCVVDGQHVAAISPQQQRQKDMGIPPVWNNYITVENVDESAAKAGELGATVHAGPFDVMEAGRMAVLQDPVGAHVCLWQPKANIGAGIVNAPGALVWNELTTAEPQKAMDFYGSLLGWTFSKFEDNPMDYWVIQTAAGKSNGGITVPQMEGQPTAWLAYFGTADLDGALAKVSEHGGGKLAGPIDIGMAKIAVVHDPQGGVFALYHGQTED